MRVLSIRTDKGQHVFKLICVALIYFKVGKNIMASEARKRVVKHFNRQLKKATGIEKDNLMKIVNTYGATKSGNLSVNANIKTVTLKSITLSKKRDKADKIQRALNPLTTREKVIRELQFMERHGLQYAQTYQNALDVLKNPNASDEQLKYYTKHIKLNSKEYKNKWIESKINQLKFYAYNERYKTNSNVDDVTEDFIDELQRGIKNNYDTDELIKKLKSIEKQREDIIKEYDKELDLFNRTGEYLL